MNRIRPFALALVALAVAPAAWAQSAAADDDATAEARVLATVGRTVADDRPVTTTADVLPTPPDDLPDSEVPAWIEAQLHARRMNEPGTPPPGGFPAAGPIIPDDTPDADVPARFEEAMRARQQEAAQDLRGTPPTPPPASDGADDGASREGGTREDGASLAPAGGDVTVYAGTTTTIYTGSVARTSQNLVVQSTAVFDLPVGTTLTFIGADDQSVDMDAPFTYPNVVLAKSGGSVTFLDDATFTAIDISDDVLIAGADITATAFTGTGGLGFSGGEATQLITLPAPAALLFFDFLKSSGTATVSQPLTVSNTLYVSGTGTLASSVDVLSTGKLELASGTLTLGADLDVFGIVQPGTGTFVRNGFNLRLAPSTSGPTVTQLAAIAGDGTVVGDAALYERPYLDGEGWRMIASPFAAQPFTTLNDDFHTQGATGADVAGGTPNVYRWVPANAPGSRYVGITDFAPAMTPGQGYFLYAYATDPIGGLPILPTTWDVTGIEPSGSIDFSLSYDVSDGEKRWNLMGNPYAAPIDWHELQTAGTMQASYGVWDPAANAGAGNYAYYNTSGASTGRANRYIPAFQGFWAESSAASPFVVTFQRTWKDETETPIYAGRTGEGVAELRLHLSGMGLESTDPVGLFLDGADNGADLYDGTWLRPLSEDYAGLFFVMPETGRRLVFDARPAAVDGEALELAIETTRGGAYTLTWPSLDAAPSVALTLVDRATGAQVDMRSQTAYTFTVGANAAPLTPGAPPEQTGLTTTARFAVHFGAVTATEGSPEIPDALTLRGAVPNPVMGGAARIRYGLPANGTVRVSVYDALGREVAVLADGAQTAGWHEAALAASSLAPGVYVVRLEADGAVQTARLTVSR